MNVSFFSTVTNKWPFQEHIPSITLPTQELDSTFLVIFKTYYYILA